MVTISTAARPSRDGDPALAAGGHFLVQETRIDGDEHEGAEYIGYDHAQQTLRSMFFSNEGPGPFCSFALEYFWQIEGDDVTI